MGDAGRPRLTALCERILLHAVRGPRTAAPLQLPVCLPRRLLAVKVHGMGDSVMVRSLLEHLHRRHPELEIGVLVGPGTGEIIGMGSQFRLHVYEQKNLSVPDILRSAAEIRRRQYEAVLNFEQGSLAGTAFLCALGIPARVGLLPLHSGTKSAFLTMPLLLRDGDLMWASFIRAVCLIDPGFPQDPPILPLPLTDEARRFARTWFAENLGCSLGRRVALHMGSGPGQPFKQWPVDRFVELGERLRAAAPSLGVILTGTFREKPLVDLFMSRYGGPAADATGLGSVERTAAALLECDLLVSNDTAIMHVGAAMGTPTVGIFGPVSPKQWAPIGPRATAVAASGVPCSPCSDSYRLRVPSTCGNPDHIRCLREVTVPDVLAAARRVLPTAWLGETRPPVPAPY